MKHVAANSFRRRSADRQRIVDTLRAFHLGSEYKVGIWNNATTCPSCEENGLGVIVNSNNTIGIKCRHCSKENILKAAGLTDASLTGRNYRQPKAAQRKTLTPPGYKKYACIANLFITGGRMDRNLSLPSANLLKIFLLLATQTYSRVDKNFDTFVTTPVELWHLLGYKTPPTYDELKLLIIECLRFVSGVQQPDGVFRGVRWFDDETKVDFSEKKIYLRLHDKCRPYLMQIQSAYAKVRAHAIFPMKSTYAILLYMQLTQYTGKNWRRTEHFVAINDLLRALMVPLKNKAAEAFWLFEKDILRPAKAEVERHSEIKFKYSVVRTAGKMRGEVVGIRFFDIQTIAIVEETGRKKIDRVELWKRIEAADHQPAVNYLDVEDPYGD